MPWPTLHPELADAKWLRSKYVDEELTSTQIADLIGATSATVIHMLKKHGIARRSPNALKFQHFRDPEWLREQYEVKGLSLEAIADLAGVPNHNRTTVRRALMRFGIPVRDNSEAAKLSFAKGRIHPNKGKPMSQGQREKLRLANLGKPNTTVWTPEMREALSAKKKASPHPYRGKPSPNRRKYFHPDPKENLRRKAIRYTLRKVGVTWEEYEATLKAQGGVCAICKQPEWTRDHNGSLKSLSIDHCHGQTGNSEKTFRGLLCQPCNHVLGHAHDNIAVLERAARWVEGDNPGRWVIGQMLCDLCCQPNTRKVKGVIQPLVRDHDHRITGLESRRGNLCHSCNVMLGHANDDPTILRAAIEYLQSR